MSEINPQRENSIGAYDEEKGVQVATVGDFEKAKIHATAKEAAGIAIVEQGHVIPTTGERKVTTRWEYWSYCLYNWGGTGVGIGNYGSAQQQQLTQIFLGDRTTFTWGGSSNTTLSSFILDLNGILFAVQLVILLIIGPYADYGNWRRWILIFWTVIGCAVSFAFIPMVHGSQWQAASALYVLGSLALNITGAFYTAPFPALVRDLPKLVESEQQVIAGTKSPEDHAQLDMIERSKLSNISFMFSGLGSAICIAINIGIAAALGHSTTDQNTKVYSVLIGFFGGIWVLTSIPWFLVEQNRPGMKLPDNTNWLTVGPKQVWEAARNASKLKQTFLYLAGYFLIADVYNTSGTIVNIAQNEDIAYDVVTYSYLFLLVYGLEVICVFLNNWIQIKFGIKPKWMFFAAACGVVFTNLWGVIGIFTTKVGYHNKWEFFFYQAMIGLLTSGWFSYGQTMMAEVSPAPKMYIFFALYNTLGKTAAFVGPFIVGAIIKKHPNNANVGFWFLFFTGLLALVLLAMVDTDKAKRDNAAYLEQERAELYASHGATEIVA